MVKWSGHAQTQLRHIHDYNAHDSPLYAKRVSEEMVRKTVGLDEIPYLGRKVPELNKEYIHAVVARNRPTDLQGSREIVNYRQFCFINMTGGRVILLCSQSFGLNRLNEQINNDRNQKTLNCD